MRKPILSVNLILAAFVLSVSIHSVNAQGAPGQATILG